MKRRAFTLIELLVVIAIISLLVTILLPSLNTAKKLARSAVCGNQLHHIGTAILFYAQENCEQLPRSTHSSLAAGTLPWGYALCTYMGFPQYAGHGDLNSQLFNGFYRCPEDRRRTKEWSYGKSVWTELQPDEIAEVTGSYTNVSYARMTDIRHPGVTIIMGELKSASMGDHIMAHFWYMGGQPEVDMLRHGKISQYVYLDGHVTPTEFKKTFDQSDKNKDKRIDNWNPATAQ